MTNKNNMRFWEALGKTDPKQTKQFIRGGGFKGTAIKPMWSYQRMTDYFGPCGIGWGMGKPDFNICSAGDEVMVYCTVEMWYRDPLQGSGDGLYRGSVFGVGGDKVFIQSTKKNRDGSEEVSYRSSDEAFKAAYTDALTNAMKLIGVAADVHMGRFDDNKYVREMEEEFAPKPDADYSPAPAPDPVMAPKPISKKQRDDFVTLVKANKRSKEAKDVLKVFGFESSGEITEDKYVKLMYWADTGKIVNEVTTDKE